MRQWSSYLFRKRKNISSGNIRLLHERKMRTQMGTHFFTFVEVAGVEPASKQGTRKLSTRLVTVSSFSVHPAGNSLTYGPASKFSPDDRSAPSNYL